MKKIAVVLGLAPQGLFLLRQLSRAGFDVHTIDSRITPGYYSKYGKKYTFNEYRELFGILNRLATCYKSKIPCYISSGPILDAVLEYFPQLYELFDVYPKPLQSVALLSNKILTYSIVKKVGIRCPETHAFKDHEKIKAGLSSINKKFIVKWNREKIDPSFPPKFKTKIIATYQDYLHLEKFLTKNEKQHLLIQEYIEGNQNHNISYQGYFSQGECIVGFLAQQLRQFPRGITSYLKEYHGVGSHEIRSKSNRLFKEMRYSGFSEVEFKFDDSFTEPYLLEINPRTPGTVSALKEKCPDLNKIFLTPDISTPLAQITHNIEWLNIGRDIGAIYHNWKISNDCHTLLSDLKTLIKPKTYDILDLSDMKPFIMQPFLAGAQLWRTM